MAWVRDDRWDCLLVAIESKDIAADVLAPEPVLEFHLKPGRLCAQCRGPFLLAEHVEELGGSHPCVEGIALQLAERFRSSDQRSVRMDNGIACILPAHVFVALRRSSLILLEAVAV